MFYFEYRVMGIIVCISNLRLICGEYSNNYEAKVSAIKQMKCNKCYKTLKSHLSLY